MFLRNFTKLSHSNDIKKDNLANENILGQIPYCISFIYNGDIEVHKQLVVMMYQFNQRHHTTHSLQIQSFTES